VKEEGEQAVEAGEQGSRGMAKVEARATCRTFDCFAQEANDGWTLQYPNHATCGDCRLFLQ
jgi:hypothetical protein